MNKIDAVMARIQEKWGQQALQTARHMNVQDKVYSSGFISLDFMIGGIPRAQITEIVGRPTSGMNSLAFHSLARSQKQGANVVIVDSMSRLNLNAAAASGVQLAKLILVEAEDLALILNLVREIIHSGVVQYLLLNLLSLHQSALSLRPLISVLHASDCALVLLLPAKAKTDSASLRLSLQRQQWLRQNGDVVDKISSDTDDLSDKFFR